jgi:hypothetical protein
MQNMSDFYIEQVRAVLDSPRPDEKLGEKHWHRVAPHVLVDPKKEFPRQIAELGLDILQTFPYDSLEDCISETRYSKAALEEQRFLRKTLMVGRDALNLANTTDLIEVPETKPLRSLIGYMGLIADTKAKKPKVLRKTIDLIEPAQKAANDIGPSYVQPSRRGEVVEECKSSLQTPLLTTSLGKRTDEDIYHRARRSFRGVVHLGIVSFLLDPSDVKLGVVMEGVELNRKYGGTHQKICK